MTSLTMNDATGQPIASTDSIKIQVYVRSSKLHKEFDVSMKEVKSLLALKGIRKLDWFKIEKDDDGKWQRLVVEDPEQEKIDDSD